MQESTVEFNGDRVVVSADENVIIDCGLLIDQIKPYGDSVSIGLKMMFQLQLTALVLKYLWTCGR